MDLSKVTKTLPYGTSVKAKQGGKFITGRISSGIGPNGYVEISSPENGIGKSVKFTNVFPIGNRHLLKKHLTTINKYYFKFFNHFINSLIFNISLSILSISL